MTPGNSRSTSPGATATPQPSGPGQPAPHQPPQQQTPEQDSSPQNGSGPTLPEHRLILELVISEPEPLSGLVGPAATPDRIAFQGWIDLMSAIHTLYADRTDNGRAPS
jgi:hypothetical protein